MSLARLTVLAALLCDLPTMLAATAAELPSFGEALVPAGRYYVGGVFGKQSYRTHTNVELRAYV